jgi:hypothetical protein
MDKSLRVTAEVYYPGNIIAASVILRWKYKMEEHVYIIDIEMAS